MQIPLDSSGVIVADVVLNSRNQILPGRESPTIILFALQDAPEAFHWTIVNTVRNSGHTLLHMVFLQPRTELLARILETSVTVEQRPGVRFKCHSCIKGVHNQRIVIVVSDLVSYNPAVIKIQNGAQVYLVNFDADVILELCHIGKPFLVRCVSMKIPVQIVLCDMCRIIAVPSATLRLPLNRRLDMLFSADSKDPLIIDIDIMMPVKFVPYSAISHIRMPLMDGLDFFCNLLVLLLAVTDRVFQPAVVGSP